MNNWKLKMDARRAGYKLVEEYIDDLMKAAGLVRKDLITEAEYDRTKDKLLRRVVDGMKDI